jgi:hypothetical protein
MIFKCFFVVAFLLLYYEIQLFHDIAVVPLVLEMFGCCF